MDSFVEAQNSLKRMSDGGCVTLLQSHAVRFVHTCGHEVAGLKTYRGAKRKEQFGVRLNGWRCVDITVQAPHKEKQEPAIDINIEPWTV